MDYVNYYITIFLLILSLKLSWGITNTGANDGSSIPKDFKRHIGLAPETNWEPGLREAAHQSLLKEHVTLSHLREKILQAPMSGQGAKVSPFGDVAILARGQLFANPHGFRFVQDPNPNDCIDCHELRKCYAKECDIYLHNGLGERLIALWTVKRLRHRNPDVRYELEYSVSPIRKHVWVTKNGGYDYSIPGHVFVVKTGQGHGHSQNGYYPGHDKYGDLPHYPHPAVPPKIHSNKHPFTPNKPPGLNTGEWVQINQPPLLPPPMAEKPPPNYYLPQKPGDQTALTSQKDVQPTLDYAEIEAYKNLLQVLHQKTSTTEQKQTSMKMTTPTKGTTPTMRPMFAGDLPTRPPLSHTTWLLPTTSKGTKPPITKTTKPQTLATSVSTTERPRTTKLIESERPLVFSKPPTFDSTKPTYITSQTKPGTTISFRPTVIQQPPPTTLQQTTRPQTTIYQQLGGFDSSKSTNYPTTLAMTQTKQTATQTMTYPMRTTLPMTHLPTQPQYPSSSFSQNPTKQRETTQPMTTLTTRKQPKPTKPMTTSQQTETTKPISTVSWTRPADGQTTSTFLFSTKVTPPFGIGVTQPLGTRYPVPPTQNTISTFYGKPGKTDYFDKTTLPMRYPTSSTFPVSTQPGSTYQGGDTTIPVRTTPGITIPVRGTEAGTTFGIAGTSRYPTTHYLPSTMSFTGPTTIYTDGTIGMTIEDHRTRPGTTNLPGATPTRPTGLLETTRVTFPTTNVYQRPKPTFFIDPTHPGYPKTTPTTPFTDGQAFKPSPIDPVYHQLPPIEKPSTIFTPQTKPTKPTTLTDFTNTDTNGNTISTIGSTDEGLIGANSGTTLLIPAPTDRYTPPPTTHNHIITLPTKLPKPSTPFKVPAIDDYEADLFPKDPNVIRSTTTTPRPTTIPTGDFILPEENYKPHPLVPELNQEEVDVFDKFPPVPSTTEEGPTTTINPIAVKEVFDSATFKPKPQIGEGVFDDFFKQDPITSTSSTLQNTGAKIIYADFFEASTVPPTRVLEQFTTIPSTSQSYSTSVSFEVNKNKENNTQNKQKVVKELKFRKAKVKEIPQPDSDYKVYKAEHPEPIQSSSNHQQPPTENQDLVENIEITHNGNNQHEVPPPRYGPKGRKYKTKTKTTKNKPTSTAKTEVTKAFDDLALQLVNHARTIDYLEGKPTEIASEKIKPNPNNRAGSEDSGSRKANAPSNTNLQNRNKYKRKSYGRVRKVKKRTENKATITRANRGAIKAHNSTTTSNNAERKILFKPAEIVEKGKIDETVKNDS